MIIITILILAFISVYLVYIRISASSELNKLQERMIILDTQLDLDIVKTPPTHNIQQNLPNWWKEVTRATQAEKPILIQGYESERAPLSLLLYKFMTVRNLPYPEIATIIISISQREVDKLEAVKNKPNTLLLIGMMGTVGGLVLSIMLTAFPMFVDRVDLEFQTILFGMGLSFGSTLIGAWLSLDISGRIHETAHKQDVVLQKLEDYAYEVVIPRIFPENELQQTNKLVAYLENYETKFNQTIQSGNEILAKYFALIEDCNNTINEMSLNISKNYNLMLNTAQSLVTNIEKITSDVSKVSTQAIQNYQNNTKELSNYRTSLEQSYQDMIIKIDDVQKRFAQNFQDAITREHKYFQEYYDSLQKNIEESRKSSLQEMGSVIGQITDKFNENVAALSKTNEATINIAHQILPTLQGIPNSLEKHQTALNHTAEAHLSEMLSETRSFTNHVRVVSDKALELQKQLSEIYDMLYKRRGVWF